MGIRFFSKRRAEYGCSQGREWTCCRSTGAPTAVAFDDSFCTLTVSCVHEKHSASTVRPPSASANRARHKMALRHSRNATFEAARTTYTHLRAFTLLLIGTRKGVKCLAWGGRGGTSENRGANCGGILKRCGWLSPSVGSGAGGQRAGALKISELNLNTLLS